MIRAIIHKKTTNNIEGGQKKLCYLCYDHDCLHNFRNDIEISDFVLCYDDDKKSSKN